MEVSRGDHGARSRHGLSLMTWQYLASGGKLALFRLGVGEPYILSHEVENELVYIDLNDVRRLTTEQRGFWDLLVLDSEGAVKFRFNLAVLFIEAFAGEESELLPCQSTVRKTEA